MSTTTAVKAKHQTFTDIYNEIQRARDPEELSAAARLILLDGLGDGSGRFDSAWRAWNNTGSKFDRDENRRRLHQAFKDAERSGRLANAADFIEAMSRQDEERRRQEKISCLKEELAERQAGANSDMKDFREFCRARIPVLKDRLARLGAAVADEARPEPPAEQPAKRPASSKPETRPNSFNEYPGPEERAELLTFRNPKDRKGHIRQYDVRAAIMFSWTLRELDEGIMMAVKTGLADKRAQFIERLRYFQEETRSGVIGSDGRRWIYNSYQDWIEHFPTWSIPTIRRVVESLENDGYIETIYKGGQNRKLYHVNLEALEYAAEQYNADPDVTICPPGRSTYHNEGDQSDQLPVIETDEGDQSDQLPANEGDQSDQARCSNRSASPPVHRDHRDNKDTEIKDIPSKERTSLDERLIEKAKEHWAPKNTPGPGREIRPRKFDIDRFHPDISRQAFIEWMADLINPGPLDVLRRSDLYFLLGGGPAAFVIELHSAGLVDYFNGKAEAIKEYLSTTGGGFVIKIKAAAEE